MEVENLEGTHLSISIDRSRERLRKPVQGDRFQNILWGKRIVNPFQEFFPNPAGVSFAFMGTTPCFARLTTLVEP